MGDRILGLDIGPSGIKAVQVAAGLNGRYRITAMAYYALGPAQNASEAILKILEDERLKSNLCITSLPAASISFRKILMPFREKKKIRQTLDFELEPLIPYAIGDVMTDFVVVNSSHLTVHPSAEASDLLVAAVPSETVAARLQALEPLRVPVIEVEAVPMALHLIAAGYDQGSYILLDVGARETAAVFFKDGRIFQVRSFAFGGDAMTAGLARALGIGFEQAEQEKRAGNLDDSWTDIAPICEKFFAELSHTLQYMHLRRGDEKPGKIIVTGGGALCRPFREQMAQYFSIAVERLDIRMMKHVSLPAETADSWKPMIMNNALALALRGTRKGAGFNFRSESIGSGYAFVKENKKRIAVVLLIVFGILAVDSVAGFLIDQRRLANLKAEITHILKKSSLGMIKSVDPVQQLRTKVNEAKQFSAGSANTEIGALDLLQKISEAVPANTSFLISDLTYDGERVEIRGETADLNLIEKIKRDIAGSGYFKDVAVSGATLIKEKNRVEFEMRMNRAK